MVGLVSSPVVGLVSIPVKGLADSSPIAVAGRTSSSLLVAGDLLSSLVAGLDLASVMSDAVSHSAMVTCIAAPWPTVLDLGLLSSLPAARLSHLLLGMWMHSG